MCKVRGADCMLLKFLFYTFHEYILCSFTTKWVTILCQVLMVTAIIIALLILLLLLCIIYIPISMWCDYYLHFIEMVKTSVFRDLLIVQRMGSL